MTQRVCVLGAGSWGSALSLLLVRYGHDVFLWSYNEAHLAQIKKEGCNTRYLPDYPFPEKIIPEPDLKKALLKSDVVLVAVPSMAFRSVLKKVKPYSFPKKIVSATKGLDPKTHDLLHLVTKEVLGEVGFAALAGPTFAKEVAASQFTAAVVASEEAEFAQFCQKLFHSDYFRVYIQPDIVGVELCGVVKNVLAIASGISDGMGLGANARSALLTRGLAEMRRLVLAMGGYEQTLLSLAGVGDLMLTAMGGLSRNRRFGLSIGEGKSMDEAIRSVGQVIEGLDNVKQVAALSKDADVSMPIVEQLYAILYQGVSSEQAFQHLMMRGAKKE